MDEERVEEGSKPPGAYSMSFGSEMRPSGALARKHRHTAVVWNTKAASVTAVLILLPPALTWWLAPALPLLGGFPGVVIAWVSGLLSAYIGYKAVVDRESIIESVSDGP